MTPGGPPGDQKRNEFATKVKSIFDDVDRQHRGELDHGGITRLLKELFLSSGSPLEAIMEEDKLQLANPNPNPNPNPNWRLLWKKTSYS